MSGWTLEEAKEHDIVERLFERCTTFDPEGKPCPYRMLACTLTYGMPMHPDWCERCIAAVMITYLRVADGS